VLVPFPNPYNQVLLDEYLNELLSLTISIEKNVGILDALLESRAPKS